MSLTQFDWIVAGVVLFIGLKGLYNGLIRELSGLIGLTIGLWTASRYAQRTGEILAQAGLPVDSPSALAMTGFLTILFLAWGTGALLGHLLHDRYTPLLTPLLRIGGLAAASTKTFLIAAATIYALFSLDFVRLNAGPYVQNSALLPWLCAAGRAVMPLPDATCPAQNENGNDRNVTKERAR